jgi:DNA-directed RNA polymerase II subunit RPB1
MSLPTAVIEGVQFYPLDSDDHLADSNVEVMTKDLTRHGLPVENGAYDAHMGTTENMWRCQSCYRTKPGCPGHSGHISLNYPVQSPIFKDDIVRWLKVICFNCGNLVAKKKKNVLEGVAKRKRLRHYVKITRAAEKNVKCTHCNTVHPHIFRDKLRHVAIWAELYNGNVSEKKYQLFNHMIAKIFDRIPEEVLTTLGRTIDTHPRKFILSILRVSPNTIRPEIKKMGGGRSNNNDITTLTKGIVEINKNLPPIIPKVIDDALEIQYTNLDLAVNELVKGTSATGGKNKMTSNTNRQFASITSRISRKAGRFRQNLMGKRTWHNARSVITCDPQLRPSELGVPKDVALKIQIPEVVNGRNRQRLMSYISNKRDVYPGCTKIIKKRTGVTRWVGNLRPDFVVEDGDIVMRDLIKGDVAIFNRQPSLLGSSMSCHTVVIRDYGSKTFGINISACVLYNADFDGDEMNLFFALSPMVRNEIDILSNVGSNFMSKKNGNPLMGCFQDTLAGVVELTRHDVTVDRRHAMELLKNIPVQLDADSYTGRDIMSLLLPPINFRTVSLFYNKAYAHYLKYRADEVNVIVKRGKLVSGIMDHKSVGQERGRSIFHTIHNEYGPKKSLDTLFNMQQVAMEFMYNKGFTVGMDDISIDDKALADIHEKISTLIMGSNGITERTKRGEIVPPIGMTVAQVYEQMHIEALRLGDDFVEPVLGNINTKGSGLYTMIAMCKKGKMKNFQAITSAIGSQLINGMRSSDNFGHKRTLPYFTRYDPDPVANGFVPDSFMSGVGPESFLFTAQVARFGVINKALSTGVTGHQNRENIKNLESIIVNNVRQCVKNRSVVQFVYGGNGIDIRKVVHVKIPTVMLSDTEMSKGFMSDPKMFRSRYRGDKLTKALKTEFQTLMNDRDSYRKIFMAIESMGSTSMNMSIEAPVNIASIVADVIYDFKDYKNNEPLDPLKAIDTIKKFCKGLPYAYTNEIQRNAGTRIPDRYVAAMKMTVILVRSLLCTAKLVENNVSNKMLDLALDKATVIIKKSLIEYGTAVGILSAQSLSEPFTQYIIDSHHRSGTGGAGGEQTDKITRSKEIMLAKLVDKMKNPSMTLYVKPEYEDSMAKVSEIANHIEKMWLSRFVASLQIFFERYGEPVHEDYKHETQLISDYEKHTPNVAVPSDLLNWVIRMTLDKQQMILKDMDLETIIFNLVKHHPKLHIVYNSENSDSIIIRCYIRGAMFKKTKTVDIDTIKVLKNTLMDTVIRGVDGIKIATVAKKNKSYIDEKGGIRSKVVYVIKTNGSNLSEIVGNKYLDVDKCQTDAIKEVEDVYGIEAARCVLRLELEKLIPDMNQTHYTVFADEMCSTGRVTGISHTGLDSREPNNVLLRASYSFTTQVLETSALNNTNSEIYGVSAPLVMGRSPYVGSLYNQIAVNRDFVEKNVTSIS